VSVKPSSNLPPAGEHRRGLARTGGSPNPLAAAVSTLWGVGPERAAQLARLEIQTIEDLLRHRPRRYEDRRHLTAIRDLQLGEATLVRGRVVAHGVKEFRRKKKDPFGPAKSLYELILDDGSALLHCRWWNMPFLEKVFRKDDDLLVYGTMKEERPRAFYHPETEVLEGDRETMVHFDRITPVYPLTEGMTQRWLRGLIWRALERYAPAIEDAYPLLAQAGWPTLRDALQALHFPAEMAEADKARERLALDEFLALQLRIQTRRRNLQRRAAGLPCRGNNRLIRPFLTRLGFPLTPAQTRVLREIREDLGGRHPMRRLLQGDVGCGKTVVAACAALMAIESGFNAVLMAPTTILAEQHFRTFSPWFSSLAIPLRLQTSGRTLENDGPWQTEPSAEPRQTGPASPPTGLIIGTHALLQESFSVPRLGLVIIDEQHKFGVAQREQLVRKGAYPHLLVMTATPIPRTLGLTLYGDLDVSVIDQLPSGRGTIRTYVRDRSVLPKVWQFIRSQLQQGRQVYVVYPRLEESDLEKGVKALLDELANLRRELAPWRVEMVHGRLSTEEREPVMEAFRRQEIQALLATSVIEVGVDVPNATVMLVENAELFGLSQLHQLRGRIGRGAHQSHCILLAQNKTPEALARLRALAETTDGFKIAEADLALRGPGEMCGREQSGLPNFRFGNLATDLPLVEKARELARRILDTETGKTDLRSGAGEKTSGESRPGAEQPP